MLDIDIDFTPLTHLKVLNLKENKLKSSSFLKNLSVKTQLNLRNAFDKAAEDFNEEGLKVIKNTEIILLSDMALKTIKDEAINF